MNQTNRIFAVITGLGLLGGFTLPNGVPGILGTTTFETYKQVEHFLLEGEDVSPGELSFVVALGSKWEDDEFYRPISFVHGCSGNLLDLPGDENDGQWILTAAHCGQKTTVVLGEVSLKKPFSELDSVQVDQALCHKEFKMAPWQHDIALLKISPAVKGVTGIPLALKSVAENESVMLAGWGSTSELQHVNVNLRPISKCSEDLSAAGLEIKESLLCSWKLGPYGGVTTKKDSGGPMIVTTTKPDGEDGKALAGVILAGNDPIEHDVHINLAYYKPWIDDVVGGELDANTKNCYGD